MMNNRRLVLVFSLMLNVFLLPLNYLSLKVDNARYEIYEYLASKTEVNPEIIFTGDSITRNGGIWAFRIYRYNLRTINIAKGGFDTDGVKYITLRAMRSNPKAIFIMSGRNDMPINYKAGNARLSIAEFKEILDAANQKRIMVFVTSTLYRADEQHPEIVDALNNYLKDYCNKNGQVYLDLNAKLSKRGKLCKEFTTDGCHVNENAYDIWAGMITSNPTYNSLFN